MGAPVSIDSKTYILRDKSKVGWSYVQPFEGLIRQREGVLTPEDNMVVSRLPYGWVNGIGWARQDRKTGRGVRGIRNSTWNTLGRQASYGILNESQTHASPADHLVKTLNFNGDYFGIFEEDYASGAITKCVSRKFNGSTDTWDDADTGNDPTFNAASSGSTGAATSNTVSHTVQSTNNGRIVCAFVTSESSADLADPTGVTYAGVAMTKLVTSGNVTPIRSSIWYLVDPSTGANNCVATWAASQNTATILHVADFYYVDQLTPFRSSGSTTDNSTQSLSLSTTVRDDDLVIGQFSHTNTGTISAGSGQTSFGNEGLSGTTDSEGSYERSDSNTTAFNHSYSTSASAGAAALVYGVLSAPNSVINIGSTNAEGVRVFDTCSHKGRMWVVGTKGDGSETQAIILSSEDGSRWVENDGTGWPTTAFFNTTYTRRNNFDDDLIRVMDFGNTLLVAIWNTVTNEIEVYYSTDKGSNWTAGAVISATVGPKSFVRWLSPFTSPPSDSPVLVTVDGVSRVDSGGATFDQIYELDGNPANGRFAAKGLDSSLYIGLGSGKVIALDAAGGTVEHRIAGPPGDGLVSARQGHPNFILAPPEPWLVVAYGGHEAGKNASIFAIEYTQKTDPDTGRVYQPWHHLYYEEDANIDCHVVGYSTEDDSTPRLHFALEGATTDECFHLERPFDNPATATQKYQATSTLEFPEDDMGDSHTDGTVHQARIEAENLGADNTTEYVEYKYGTNGGAWDATDLGDFLSGDLDLIHGSGAGVTAKTLRNSLVGHRDGADTTDTVLLKDFEVWATKQQQVLRSALLTIDLDATVKAAGSDHTNTENVIANLETVMKTGKVAFSIGSLSTMYVRVRQPQAWELEAFDEGGGDGEGTGVLHGVAQILVEEVLEGSPQA